jgi:parvulin-like peptidyl-prolyl isomerase
MRHRRLEPLRLLVMVSLLLGPVSAAAQPAGKAGAPAKTKEKDGDRGADKEKAKATAKDADKDAGKARDADKDKAKDRDKAKGADRDKAKGARAGKSADGRLIERVVAVVNDEIILLSEVEERVGPIMAEMDRQGELAGRNRDAQIMVLRRRVLDMLIDERLLLNQAHQLKLGVTSEEIDRALEEIRKQNNVDLDDLVKALRQQGMSMAQYRQDLRKQILRLKVINAAVRSRISVSDEEVRNYYEQVVRRSGTNRTVRASHIFVAIPEDATPKDVERKRKQAGDLVERARAGEDFAKLARAHSEDPATKEEGGDLGFFSRGSLPAAVEEIVFGMDIGEVRGPIRAARGFHVLKLLARKDEGIKPLKEIKEQLRQQLYAQEMEKATKSWLQEIRKKAHIETRM